MKSSFTLICSFLLFAAALVGQDVQYKPGGKKFAKKWTRFYAGDYEPDLPVPLVKAGSIMAPITMERNLNHQ